jgi:hypothetical protein
MDIANACIEAIDLPADVRRRIRKLMSRLGLVYGAIDLRLTSDGQHVFLEINPAGQWLFVETRLSSPSPPPSHGSWSAATVTTKRRTPACIVCAPNWQTCARVALSMLGWRGEY